MCKKNELISQILSKYNATDIKEILDEIRFSKPGLVH